MNKHQNHTNLSEQFKSAVSEAISTGDFARLNFLVSDTLSDVISEATRQVKNATGDVQTRHTKAAKSFHTKATTEHVKPSLPTIRSVGQVSSILYKVFGGIATGITSSVLLGMLLAAVLGGIYSIPKLIFTTLIFGSSLLLLSKGISQSKRLSRMKRYVSICAGKMYMNISDLAKHANKSPKYILKDIKKMLALGFFPEGHLDEQETCLMLDDATYREYLRLEKERKAYTASVSDATTTSQHVADTHEASNNPELDALVREGKDYINKLHELNDIIEDAIVSDKLYRMENLLREIFDRVKEDPSQMPHMHKLMNYYLPTTIKLLQAYADFDDVSTPGSDILNAKQEIEKTIDTINEAFTELLNKLFHDTVFDVTTDAQVLQTMLAKEGLTKNKFSEDKK